MKNSFNIPLGILKMALNRDNSTNTNFLPHFGGAK
jgi:hypothetical protein